jgi:hypothetical protein
VVVLRKGSKDLGTGESRLGKLGVMSTSPEVFLTFEAAAGDTKLLDGGASLVAAMGAVEVSFRRTVRQADGRWQGELCVKGMAPYIEAGRVALESYVGVPVTSTSAATDADV